MLKTLAKSIRQYKRESILSPVLVTLEVLLECMIPLYMSTMLKDITDEPTMSNILIYGAILLVMAAFSLLFGILAGKYAATASAGFARNLRHDIYYKIQDFSFANIDKFSTSSLVTRMTTDVTNIQMAYMMIVRVAFRSPVMMIVSLAMTYSINWQMGVIFTVLVPILGVGLVVIFKMVVPIFNKVFKKYDALNESVQENIKGIRVVKSYVREDYEIDKFDKAAENVRADFARGEKIIALNNPLMQFCMWTAITMICFVGSMIVMQSAEEALNRSDLMILIVYAAQTLSSLTMLSMIMVMISIAKTSADRVVEVLNEESTLTDPENPVYEVPNGDVEFDGVDFKYSEKADRRALKEIDLKVKSGQTIGILGGTGSSKTSLVNSRARSRRICVGATPTRQTRSWCASASSRRRTSSFRASPTSMTPTSNRAAATSRAVKSRDFALRAHCSKSQRY